MGKYIVAYLYNEMLQSIENVIWIKLRKILNEKNSNFLILHIVIPICQAEKESRVHKQNIQGYIPM